MMLDVGILVVWLISTLVGWFRGLLRELLSLVSWIVAAWVAYQFRIPAGKLLESWIDSPLLQQSIAGFALFVITVLLLSVFGKVTTMAVEKVGMRGADRSLGIVFGVVRGLVLAAGVVLLLRAASLDAQPWWQSSLLVGPLDRPADMVEQGIKLMVAKIAGSSSP
ncbi:MAG: CvpA family protein [Immundisolibacteraceae bacterium]|nr:CvpA family protein [Immundisolibacteraceae bacterium]